MGIGLSAIIVFCQALVNKYRLSYMFGKFLLKLTDFLVGKFRGLKSFLRGLQTTAREGLFATLH